MNYTLADYLAHPCVEGRHAHFSRSQLRPFLEANRVVVLQGCLGESRRQQAKRKETKTVVWIIPEEGSVTGSPFCVGHINQGLSFKYGEELAKRIRQGESWALAMWAQIRGAREGRFDNPWVNRDCNELARGPKLTRAE